jgi:hypothetical protein
MELCFKKFKMFVFYSILFASNFGFGNDVKTDAQRAQMFIHTYEGKTLYCTVKSVCVNWDCVGSNVRVDNDIVEIKHTKLVFRPSPPTSKNGYVFIIVDGAEHAIYGYPQYVCNSEFN